MKKILVIDSSQPNISAIQATVTELFHDCYIVHLPSYNEIHSKVRKEQPDIILLNIDLNDYIGLHHFRQLKLDRSTKDIPIFVISNFKGTSNQTKEVLLCGADGYLSSPIDSIGFYAQIRSIWKEMECRKNREHESSISNGSMNENRQNSTEKKEKWEQKHFLLNSILENTESGLLVIDKNGRIIHSNSKFTQLWGIPDDLIRKKEDHLLLNFVLEQLEDADSFLTKVHSLYGSFQFDQDILRFKDGRRFKRISYPLVVEQDLEGRVWSFTDISHEQKAEELMRKLNKAVTNSREVIFMTDIDGIFTFVNPEFSRLYGYTSDEVIGKVTPRIIKCDETPNSIHKEMWHTLLGKRSFTAQYKNRCKNGQLIEVEVNVDPIIGDSNEVIGFLAIQRNISSRKEAEAKLEQRLKELSIINAASKKLQKIYTTKSLARELASVLENYLHGAMGEIVLLDESGKHLIPYTILDAKSGPMEAKEELSHSNFPLPLGKGITGWVAKTGESLCVGDVRNDTRYFPHRTHIQSELCVPLKIGNRILGVINLESPKADAFSTSDVRLLEIIANQMSVAIQNTRLYQKLKDELKQRRRMERVQNILFKIVRAVYTSKNLELFIKLIRDELGTLIDTTNFYVAMYHPGTKNFSIPYLADQKVVDLHSFPAGKSLTAYVLRTKQPQLVTLKTLRQLEYRGEVVTIGRASKVWLGVPLTVNEQVIGVCSVQSYEDENAYSTKDLALLEFVTNQVGIAIERKKADEGLMMALEKAQESDRLKSAFLEAMSHELRTPLNAVIGFSDLIMMEESIVEIKDYAKTIHESGHQLLGIVEDILDITLIEANDIAISKEKHYIYPIMESILEEAEKERRRMHKTSTHLVFNCPEQLRENFIYTDVGRLSQIFMCLLRNALKFTPEGRIEFGYDLADDSEKSKYLFYVKDTGIGIPEDQKQVIFGMFRQGDDTTTRGYGGVGIGLTLAKKLTSLLGGNIWFESTLGLGSIFYFTIPLQMEKQRVMSSPLRN